jgi:protein PhnA
MFHGFECNEKTSLLQANMPVVLRGMMLQMLVVLRRGVMVRGDIPFFAESRTMSDDEIVVKDANGNRLNNGDSVSLIKDLPVKGANVTLKRGTVAKNIRLTDDPAEIECNVDKVRGLVLKTCFVKKA